ncbi:hypothetical protein JVU11DRAFT_11518 [Chiua virens]|nr:hypothetical protein JVU11DRAFT_11518 [Chiua virens]
MDYLFFSTVHNNGFIKVFNILYDITCQWMRCLWQRMKTLLRPLCLPYQDIKVRSFIPKFHLPAHIAECQWKHSFNYAKGVARTDGKAPERTWSTLNPMVSSTKEMGPGHQHDTLDDLIGDSNWKKIVGMGTTILCKLIKAVLEQNEHQEGLEEFKHSLAGRYGGQLAKWREQVEAWEEDVSQPNPFEIKSNSASDILPIHTNISLSVLISTGLELEKQQPKDGDFAMTPKNLVSMVQTNRM